MWQRLRYDVLEVVEQVEQLLRFERISILSLDTSNFVCYTPMHIFRRFLVDITERIFYCILVYPNTCSQFIAFKVLQRGFKGFFIGISFVFHDEY